MYVLSVVVIVVIVEEEDYEKLFRGYTQDSVGFFYLGLAKTPTPMLPPLG